MTKAILIGAGGGMGRALATAMEARGDEVIRLWRHSNRHWTWKTILRLRRRRTLLRPAARLT